MIAFVQPFGLSAAGGGARILRSLLAEVPFPSVSVCTGLKTPSPFDSLREYHLPTRPHFGRIEGTRIARPLSALSLILAGQFKRRLRKLFLTQSVCVVHAIPHGMDFWYAFEVARDLDLPYVLTVHDDMSYNLRGRVYVNRAMDRLATVWREADARMVISEAMGEAYNERYGERSYSVVTDGLQEISAGPVERPEDRLHVYFMGSVHMSYRDNFQSLLDSLNIVSAQRPDLDVQLTIRGGLPFHLDTGSIPCAILGWGRESDIERDLRTADLLYLPLPFHLDHEAFVRYSLSTKMVTYLGSGIPLLYHGPKEAAAYQLLASNGAGILSSTRNSSDFANQLINLHRSHLDRVSHQALDLAYRQFMLSDQREKFWSIMAPYLVSNETLASAVDL